jgi:hypothetical protein
MACDSMICPIAGQGCVATGSGPVVCDGVCEQDRCRTGSECIAGTCLPVLCGVHVPCSSSSDICDPSTHRCLPESGDCAVHGCPAFEPIQQLASIACEGSEKLCRTRLRPRRIADLPNAEIVVTSPEPGQAIATEDALTMRWDAVQELVIVNVFDELPATVDRLDELARHVIWGAVVLPSQAPRLTWADGYTVHDGIWQPGPPDPPEPNAHALLVVSVHDDRVLAASNLIAFWIGSDPAWRVPGELCADDVGIPGDCYNPAAPQACWRHQCRRLCSSNADCPGTLCEHTNSDGFRACSL